MHYFAKAAGRQGSAVVRAARLLGLDWRPAAPARRYNTLSSWEEVAPPGGTAGPGAALRSGRPAAPREPCSDVPNCWLRPERQRPANGRSSRILIEVVHLHHVGEEMETWKGAVSSARSGADTKKRLVGRQTRNAALSWVGWWSAR